MSNAGDIRVLHVDDETDFAEVAAMHLENVDEMITVATEGSASDGLERLRATQFDCVVSDHDMPSMNGLEFLKAVRSEYPELPFILFTGKGNEEIASDAISAGVTEYLQKDVGTDQYTVLANRIRRAVGERRAKSALQESERQLSTLISNLPGMVYRARNEPDWPMEFVSDGAAELVEYDADTIESGDVSWRSLVYDADQIKQRVQRCVDAGEPFEVSYRIETKSGEARWVWERGRVVGSTDDDVELIEGFITDITARKEREQELKREREFTERLVDTLEDVFYLVSPDGDLLRWNDTAVESTGYSDAELTKMTAFDLIPEPFHEKVTDVIAETVENGQATFEAPVETSDGELLHHEFRGSVIKDSDGNLQNIAGIARRITEQERRQRRFEQYETLVENVGDAMYVLDTDGTIQMVNDAMAARLGYSREEIVGSDPTRFIDDGDVATATETIADLLEQPDQTWATLQMELTDADGTRVINENRITPLLDADGQFLGSVGVMRDVTERRERQRDLERYETIVEAVGDPVYALDETGVFTFVNEAIEPITGYGPEELIGQHIGTIITETALERGDKLIKQLLGDPETDSGTLEMDIVTKEGERIPSENNLALLPTPEGTFTGTAGVIRDIHERKEREQRLAEFASVVSHDLRNPLNVVQGRLELIEESGDMSHLDAASDATDRMEQLIEDLLTLARQGETVGTADQVDLSTTAQQAWDGVDTGGATLSVADTETVEADPARLRELFENLFRNSVEHGTGRPESYDNYESTSRRPPDDSVTHDDLTVTVGSLTDGGSTVGFYVADDGYGVPSEDHEDVFKRGYTTARGGTGFGLAIVEDIATAHGWSVDVTDSANGGARFEFTTTRDDH